MPIWVLVVIVYLTLSNFRCILSHTENIDHPIYDKVTTADYKVTIDAGKKDCYHQFTQKGALFYIDFNVISGGDGKTGFEVSDPNGEVVMSEVWKEGGSYETSVALDGYYAACIDNGYSIFSSKLVNVYFHTYIEDYVEPPIDPELEIEIGLENLTRILSSAGNNINKMVKYLHQSKADEARDFSLLEKNNFYVSFWSSAECMIILIVGGLHVYFIRKLFEAPKASNTKYNNVQSKNLI